MPYEKNAKLAKAKFSDIKAFMGQLKRKYENSMNGEAPLNTLKKESKL
jgi:hypothetical protein